jgi:hypothetical protein
MNDDNNVPSRGAIPLANARGATSLDCRYRTSSSMEKPWKRLPSTRSPNWSGYKDGSWLCRRRASQYTPRCHEPAWTMEPNFEMFERPDAYDHHPYDGRPWVASWSSQCSALVCTFQPIWQRKKHTKEKAEVYADDGPVRAMPNGIPDQSFSIWLKDGEVSYYVFSLSLKRQVFASRSSKDPLPSQGCRLSQDSVGCMAAWSVRCRTQEIQSA